MNLALVVFHRGTNNNFLWSQTIISIPKRCFQNLKSVSVLYKYISLWGIGQISKYKCNFCAPTEIFTNSKFFDHLIIRMRLENQIKSL